MKRLALEALDAAMRRGVSYADMRVIEIRDRQVSTKNGKAGHVSSSVSMGLGIRVLAHGCWGFAATDDLTRMVRGGRRPGAGDRARGHARQKARHRAGA